jgi:predicted PurR-regulated permease PerM
MSFPAGMRHAGSRAMADSDRRTALTIPWRTLLKIIAAAALVWCLLRLLPIILVILVAIVVAVTLDPVAERLERRGMSRRGAAMLLGTALLALLGAFVWVTWSSLTEQALYTATHFRELEQRVLDVLPAWARQAATVNGQNAGSWLSGVAVRFGQSAMWAAALIVLGLVLTIYFLIEGQRTHDWLVAFVPRRHRAKVDRTLAESREVIYAYVVGNVITSVIAAVCTFVALWWLEVPAALLLAVIAGLSDFVPVIGFVLSAIPAIVLALTVSAKVTLIVIAFYIVYNTVENYLISPWAYGDRMKLSDLAVILAFAAGAQLGGVIGALLALPIAAIYPTVERIWLRERLPEETIREHAEMTE